MKLPVAGGSYEDVTSLFSSQRSKNCYVELGTPSTRSPGKLRSDAGFDLFTTLLNSPIRKFFKMRREFYAVAGNQFFKLESDGTFDAKGILQTNGGRVSMAGNGVEIVVVDGNEGYIYSKTTDKFEIISDPDFLPSISVTYLDGFFVFVRTDSEEFFISNLLDGFNYNPLDRAKNVRAPDDTLAVVSDHGELWFFGRDVTEVWADTGNPDFPFEPIPGATIERGIAATHSVGKDENTLFWLGDDLIVYMAVGYQPVRISNHALEERFSKFSGVSDAWGRVFTQNGHKFYVLTFPGAGETWIYDTTVSDPALAWHQRESFNKTRWLAEDIIQVFDKTFIGDFETGRIGVLNEEITTEFGDLVFGVRRTSTINASQAPFIIDRLELVIDAGIAASNDDGTEGTFDPEVGMRISIDGGKTFGPMQTVPMGKLGQYLERVVWWQLGRHINSVFEFTFSTKLRWAIVDSVIEAEETYI